MTGIQIIGNEKTKAEVIIRELVFQKGDSIPASKLNDFIKESKNNLLNSSLFNFVTIHPQMRLNKVFFVVIVEERWYLWPIPIIEQADRNINSWLQQKDYKRVNYGLHLIKYNFRGRREVLNLKIRLGYREQYMISYENPYLDAKKKFGLFIGYSLFRQHELAYITNKNKLMYYNDDQDYVLNETRSDIGITYRNKWYNSHYFQIGYNRNEVMDTITVLNPDYQSKKGNTEQFFKLKYDFDFDKRDSKIYPLYGSRYFISLTQNGLGILSNTTENTILKIGLQQNYKISQEFYIQFTNKTQYSFNTDMPFYMKSALGYYDYLRGYEYYVIKGQDYFIQSIDVKYALMPKKIIYMNPIPFSKFNKTHLSIFLNTFFDIGYISDNNEYNADYLANECIYSYGIGVDIVTYYDKILQLNIARNNYKEMDIFIHFKVPF